MSRQRRGNGRDIIFNDYQPKSSMLRDITCGDLVEAKRKDESQWDRYKITCVGNEGSMGKNVIGYYLQISQDIAHNKNTIDVPKLFVSGTECNGENLDKRWLVRTNINYEAGGVPITLGYTVNETAAESELDKVKCLKDKTQCRYGYYWAEFNKMTLQDLKFVARSFGKELDMNWAKEFLIK